MTRRTHRPIAAAGALMLLLAGCTPDTTTPNSSPTPTGTSASPSTTGSGSSTPNPTSTLTAAQKRAFDEATEVVLAYRQTITDLLTRTRTRLNDLNDVATGDLVNRDLKDVSQALARGNRAEPENAQLVLVAAEPISVNLRRTPPTVVVRACIDATGVTDVAPDGQRSPGVRESLNYTVVKTTYLPDPGWAVSRLTGAPDPQDRAC